MHEGMLNSTVIFFYHGLPYDPDLFAYGLIIVI